MPESKIEQVPFARVDAALRSGDGDEYTGAVARIEHRGRVVFERAYGATRDDALGRPVYCDTRFDLASLTKLFVATLALQLVAQNRLSLDEPLPRSCRNGGGPHAAITARMLLAHDLGNEFGRRLSRDSQRERRAFRADAPSCRGAWRARHLQRPRASSRWRRDRTHTPAFARITRCARFICEHGRLFSAVAPIALAIPATEDDAWRGRAQGFVHDEKAYLMGGAAGHAGLFGTAADVAAMTECYLGRLHGRIGALLPASDRARSDERTSLGSRYCVAVWAGRSKPTTKTRAAALWTRRRLAIPASSVRACGPIRCATFKACC